jgi:hypothetical protein
LSLMTKKLAVTVRFFLCFVAVIGLMGCKRSTDTGPKQEDIDKELSNAGGEERPIWSGTAVIRLTGAINLNLTFDYVDTSSPLRGPGLVHLIFENGPYVLDINGEPGNPTSQENPMILLLSNEDDEALSGKAPECTFTFPKPGPDAIAGDMRCNGLQNTFTDAPGAVNIEGSLSIGPPAP